jgi:hypothetical protein
MALGFSYQPGSDVSVGPSGQQSPQVLPQQAAKVLSLRLPKNLGQSPIAARELLMAPGAGGSPNLNAIIAALMRSMQAPENGFGQAAPRPAGSATSYRDFLQQENGLNGRTPDLSGGVPVPRFQVGNTPGYTDQMPEGAAFDGPYQGPYYRAPGPGETGNQPWDSPVPPEPLSIPGQPPGYHGLEYWSQQNQSPIGENGDVASGWSRTGTGYEPLERLFKG